MSKLLVCPCGTILSKVEAPNSIEGLLHSLCLDIYAFQNGRDAWECKECGRLAVIFPEVKSSRVKWYAPEDKEPGDLL